jgi:hypothetical protein
MRVAVEVAEERRATGVVVEVAEVQRRAIGVALKKAAGIIVGIAGETAGTITEDLGQMV